MSAVSTPRAWVAAGAAAALLTGCASPASDRSGGAQTPAAPTAPSTVSPPTEPTEPTGPTEPPWPGYPEADYRYELTASCFCSLSGVPVIVTVRDGKVTEAVYARSTRGLEAGEPVSARWLRLSINDIIDSANDPDAAQVQVRWPAGQTHPSRVWIDRIENAVDDEVGYRIRHVEPGLGRAHSS